MLTYDAAGVSIAAGDETVDKIKPFIRRTFTPQVLADIGLFGGLYDARFPDYEHPVLVASTDGVGTKLKIAFTTGIHDTIGQDLVNHCVNDILACGARPLFFLDYFATGRLNPDIAADVIKGLALACEQNKCALIGGETAEMPSMYADGEYDMAGTIVGVVEKSRILPHKDLAAGDILIGLESSGLHTNGYSLARAALFPKYDVNQHIDELGTSLGRALLAVHRSYLNLLWPLLQQNLIKGLSHITGGGIVGNTKRIVPEGLTLRIDWDAWQIPALFRLIQHAGDIPEEEMRKAFNLGIGMILAVHPDNVNTIMQECAQANPCIVGQLV
jgi:phosphoribosylformylglycinamidine cyclo-ligase